MHMRTISMEAYTTSRGSSNTDKVDEFLDEIGLTVPNCGACLSNMAITPGGNVVPCQSWLEGAPLGNMLKEEWFQIWENNQCRERRDYSAKMLCECPLRIYRGKAGK